VGDSERRWRAVMVLAATGGLIVFGMWVVRIVSGT
jgi:hypothetical protein